MSMFNGRGPFSAGGGGAVAVSNYTLATMPSPAGLPNGMRIFVSDDVGGGQFWVLKGGLWTPPNRSLAGLNSPGVSASVSGVETVLGTVPLGATGAVRSGDDLLVTSHWSTPNNANNKTIRTKLGPAAAGIAATQISGATFASALSWSHTARLISFRPGNVQVSRPASLGSGGMSTAATVVSAVNIGTALELVFTGMPATAGDTVTLEYYSVELLRQ